MKKTSSIFLYTLMVLIALVGLGIAFLERGTDCNEKEQEVIASIEESEDTTTTTTQTSITSTSRTIETTTSFETETTELTTLTTVETTVTRTNVVIGNQLSYIPQEKPTIEVVTLPFRPQTTETTSTTVETTTTTTTEASQTIEPIFIYKPSSHYVHCLDCKWNDGTGEAITSTEGLEVLYCEDCKPDIKIYDYYVVPVETGVDSYDRELLAEITYHEAGSDWITIYEKACIVAGVMNRVNDSRFPSTVYGVLTQKGQFGNFYPYYCTPTQECYDAVDYYFEHTDEFGTHNSWYGDGKANHFYYQ